LKNLITTEAKGALGGKVDQYSFQNELNKLGSQRELVNTVGVTQSYGSTKWIVSIFKRKIQYNMEFKRETNKRKYKTKFYNIISKYKSFHCMIFTLNESERVCLS
jgi:hypothetical protein